MVSSSNGPRPQRLADVGWIEWGGQLIWVAGYTSGGAPYGLRVCDFDRADLEAMGLDVEALDDAGLLATAPSSTGESNDRLGDATFHSELVSGTTLHRPARRDDPGAWGAEELALTGQEATVIRNCSGRW